MQPLVTIITPSYNQGNFIEQTILSVLNQAYTNIQYIVMDGGSTDNTMQIVNKYADRIAVIVSEKDKGQADAINKGFKLAKGELVGWINSDDVLESDAVKEVVEAYKAHSTNAVIIMPTRIDWVDENGKYLTTKYINGRKKSQIVNNDYNIIQPGSFYKRDTLIQIQYCNDKLHYCMDLDLILRLLNYGEIYFINKNLAQFRIHTTTKTNTGGNAFLNEIKATLKQHNMKLFSKNSYKLYLYGLKNTVKNALGIY